MAEPAGAYTHRGTRAVQRMVEHAPSSGGLALWVRHVDLPKETPEGAAPNDAAQNAPLVSTDGRSVFYRPGFEALSVPQQTGWVAHQVLHIALRHAQRFVELQQRLGDADLRLFNVCADAIVNSTLGHLGWLELPARAVRLERLVGDALGLVQGAEAALLAWDVESLYRAIDDRRPPTKGRRDANAKPQRAPDESSAPTASGTRSPREDGPRAARARSLGGAASDLVPGSATLGAPEDEAELSREWRERMLRAHAGDGAHSMLRALLADLPRSRTPWEQVLRVQLARGLAQKPGLSWSRPARSYLANQGRAGPHRRMPWEPGTVASRTVPRLAVVVDVSGSIDNALMQRFATEIESLSRRLEAALVLVVGDDRVRHVEHFEPGRSKLREITFVGGGGTDFTPRLEEAARHCPDIAVVLTDLEGPARFQPRRPVLWAVPERPQALPVAPFGRLLALH